ncbi:hypothetical protein HYU13_04815 [Candidatus Woesearchaeota archaeon]|nr:hypothetical protein [Candidatus Woesearchaeota archaeon]
MEDKIRPKKINRLDDTNLINDKISTAWFLADFHHLNYCGLKPAGFFPIPSLNYCGLKPAGFFPIPSLNYYWLKYYTYGQ